MGVLSGYEIITDSVTPEANPYGTFSATLTMDAPEGKKVFSIGHKVVGSNASVLRSEPSSDGSSWTVEVGGTIAAYTTGTLTAWAICAETETTLSICEGE